MALNVVISPLVRFKVEGSIASEDGADIPFDFLLTAERLGDQKTLNAFQDEIKSRSAAGSITPVTDALVTRMRDWHGPQREGQAIPFTPDALRSVLDMPGMAQLVYLRFLGESGVKAKNS